MSVWLWNLKDGESQKARFLFKNQHTQNIFFELCTIHQKVTKSYLLALTSFWFEFTDLNPV